MAMRAVSALGRVAPMLGRQSMFTLCLGFVRAAAPIRYSPLSHLQFLSMISRIIRIVGVVELVVFACGERAHVSTCSWIL